MFRCCPWQRIFFLYIYVMSPFGIVAIIGGGLLLLSAAKTLKTAQSLNYQVLRFGIYNFVKNGKIVFRLRMRFFNPSDNALNVQYIQLAAYWGASYEKNGNNITNVISRGTELTSVVDTKGFKIDPNSFVDVDFFLETKWLNLLSIIGSSALNILINGNDFNLNDFVGKPILIQGTIKAEGVKVDVLTDYTLVDDTNEN